MYRQQYQQQRPKYFGVTPPISESLPTAHDLESTSTLVQELKQQGQYESQEEASKR